MNTKESPTPILRVSGHCTTCNSETEFTAYNSWLRDHFICAKCGSIPRERALMAVIQNYYPNWRNAVIHESSPSLRGASLRLASGCPNYIPTQYYPDHAPGTTVGNMRCENLEAMSFPDQSIDLHITQDVLEHLFKPAQAFKEIERTLKPGGMHIFTVPITRKFNPTQQRARLVGEEIQHFLPEEYHGNPVGDGRSLVTFDWGYDLCQTIFESSGLFTYINMIDDMSRGIRAEYIDVLVTIKPKS